MADTVVDVWMIRKSQGADYFVRLRCEGREVTPYRFTQRWMAEHEAAVFQWLLGHRPTKPEFDEFSPETHPDTH